MPLSPQDVSNKRFTPVRFRDQGYDMGEVDQFLDEVEAELSRLLAENADLRGKLGLAVPEPGDGARGAGSEETPDVDDPQAATGPEVSATDAETSTDSETAVEPAAQPAAASPTEQVQVVTRADASAAATRLLELATRNADEVVAEARQEAAQIVGSAREQAESLDREARQRSENLDQETAARREDRLATIEAEKARLDQDVDDLRAFEREYRSRLRSYFTQQLDALDGRGEGGELPAAHGHPQDAADQTAPEGDAAVDGASSSQGEDRQA